MTIAVGSEKQGETRCAFITGAIQGIGLHTAKKLFEDGFKVALMDIEAKYKELQNVCQDIQAVTGNEVICFQGDVASEISVKSILEQANVYMGGLDVVVANAGIVESKTLLDSEPRDYDLIFRINVIGVHNTIKAAAKIMIHDQQKGGRIIIAGSEAGHRPDHELCAYSASKWAVRGLTQAAAIELLHTIFS